ncbi:MAG TPA: hypothetical protein VNO51_23960 [Ilumatobacteraceae bacterium]|nr:hypothetical protein [Ilumatobacteraceae bacterium]
MPFQSTSTYELRFAGAPAPPAGKKGVSPARLLTVNWEFLSSGSRQLTLHRDTDVVITPMLLGALARGQRLASVAVDVFTQSELQVTIELVDVAVQTYEATAQADMPIDTEVFTLVGSSMTFLDPRVGKAVAL